MFRFQGRTRKFFSRIKKIAAPEVVLGKHSVQTHIPEDLNCEICRRRLFARNVLVMPHREPKHLVTNRGRPQCFQWRLWVTPQSPRCNRGTRFCNSMDSSMSVQNEKLTVQRQYGIAKTAVPKNQRSCSNLDWTENGGQIPWRVSSNCETFRPLFGRENTLWSAIWWTTFNSTWFSDWISPDFCSWRPAKDPTGRDESFARKITLLRIVCGRIWKGDIYGSMHWGSGQHGRATKSMLEDSMRKEW